MKTTVTALLVGAAALTGQQAAVRMAEPDPVARTYEHLATAIISLRETETGLVRGILDHYQMRARHQLRAAMGAEGDARRAALEGAATEIGYLAAEGDKAIQAVRQRLVKAGHHHHHAEGETEEDYIWIDADERKGLLSLATRVSRMGADAAPAAIEKAIAELDAMCMKAMQPE